MDHILRHTEKLWEDLRGQSVFLTGGTAFVGTWLLESLLWAADRLDLSVTVVVLTAPPSAVSRKVSTPRRTPRRPPAAGRRRQFRISVGAFPFVIHAQWSPLSNPMRSVPLGAFGSNVDGTRRVLEFARSHGTRRFLFTSSGAVYGKQPPEMTHIPEDYSGAPSTVDPGSSTDRQNARPSSYRDVWTRYGFDATIARLFAFVGPLLPLDSNFAVGNFIRDVLRGGPVRIGGDGTPLRSYLYAADLAIWLWTILREASRHIPIT